MILPPTRLIRLLALGATLLLASSLHAQTTVLADWKTTGLSAGGGSSNLASSNEADHVIVGDLTRGAGMPYISGTTATNNTWKGTVTTNYSSFAAALSAANYFSFTLAPETGHSLTIESISFGFTVGSTTLGINTGQWQYSIDGSAYADFGSSVKCTTASGTYLTVDGDDFNVADGSTMTFRFVAWAANGTTSNSKSWGVTDKSGAAALTVYGEAATAAVPEPATYAAILGGLALAGVVLRRRRRA